MKGIKRDLATWGMICLFLVVVFILYNHLENEETINLVEETNFTELHPVVAEKTDQLIETAAKKNIDIIITETVRSAETQNELYAKGRTAAGNIVTYAKAGESYHNYGLAIDFALITENGDVIWDIHYDGNGNGEPDWFEVAAIAKDLGFEWGGDWKNFKDYPHLQMTFGLSISQLQRGLRPDYEEAHK